MLGRFVVIAIFTARKRSLGQGNIFAPSCHSDRYTPLGRYTPPGRYTPQAGTPLGRYTPHPGQVHPPGRYIPPGAVYAVRYGQQAGGMHPTGMHSCVKLSLKCNFISDHILASAATNGAVVTWNLNKSSRSKQGKNKQL